MRVIARRERPHPGAQLDLIEERDGWRYTCFATDTAHGQRAWLDARHRAHARVEDRIRCGKDTGLARMPSKRFAINQAWLACVLTAIDLIAWTQTTPLHDEPTWPEPNRRRCATGCCTWPRDSSAAEANSPRLKIDKTCRWATTLARAFHRLAALPTPPT